jgi:hypothetical protein
MAFIPLQLPPGIERNNSPYDTPDRWWDMNQVRWLSGNMLPVGGWQRKTPANAATPVQSATSVSGTGGTLAAGTYYYKITALNSGGETIGSNEQSAVTVGTTSRVTLTWSKVHGASSYRVYRGTSSNGQNVYYAPGNVLTYQDTGAVATAGSPPSTNTTRPLDTLARAFHVWRNNTAARAVLIGTDAKLYADDSGAYVDITPPGLVGPGTVGAGGGGYGTFDYGAEDYGDARSMPSPIYSPYGYWSFGQWGEDVIVNANTDGKLYYYDQSAPATAPVQITATAGSTPIGATAVLVTPERHVMIIGTNGDPRSIGWSSSEDYQDWDFASTTNTAGKLPLRARTPLLKGWSVAEGTLVMSYTDVFLIRYTGEPYIYSGTDPISDTSLFNPMSVATFGGKAAWPSRMGFQLYAGGYVQPLPCPVFEDIMSGHDESMRMDPTYGPFRMHGCHNFRFPEIWWFYPSVGNTECNRYIAWNYAENFWFWGELPRTAMAPADAYQYPYMGGADGHIYEHEFGWLANGATRAGQVWAETGALGLGAGDRTMDVHQMLIASGHHDADDLSVQVFGKMTPEGPEYSAGPFVPRSDGYTDARFSFRHPRLRFTNNTDGHFSIGRLMLDVTQGTGR